MTYLLDTDVCRYLMKRTHAHLVSRVRAFRPRELKVSAVTVFELEFGARRSGRYEALARVIHTFLANVEVPPSTLGPRASRGRFAPSSSPRARRSVPMTF